MSNLVITIENHTFEVEMEWGSPGATEVMVHVNGEAVRVRLPDVAAALEEIEWLMVADRPYEIVFDPDLHWLKANRGIHRVEVHNQEAVVGSQPTMRDGRLKAPIPGLVTRVLVQPGERVEAGQPVVVLEAMKMENEIRATRTGVITSLHVTPGQSVVRNELLAEIISE